VEEFLKQNWLTLCVFGSVLLGYSKAYSMLTTVHETTKNIEKILFGNGKPGIVRDIENIRIECARNHPGD